MAYLELSHVHKSFAGINAVEDFNLRIGQGEFISFLGPSGCGKTTTLRMIAGFELPSAGQITLEGKDVTFLPPNKRNVGMVFQSYALFPNMTVVDNIGYGLKVAGKSKTEIKQRVDEMLALVHLERFGARYPAQLSGGQQQRVALARALAIRPHMLLLDEPLSALDAKIRVSLRNEIRAIQRQLGITTIYVTHDQEEALSLSDQIVVMNNGRIEQIGTPFEIYNFPKTTFVASFVGMLNTLAATVVDAAQRQLRVNGQDVFGGQAMEHLHNGAQVKLALRPEQLRLERAREAENALPGTVENISFLGSIVRVSVKVGESTLALDEFNHPHLTLPEIGQGVTVYFPRVACLVLGEE